VSEFVGCSPSLSADDVAQAMRAALTMRTEEKLSRHRRNYSFIATHSVVTWARAFDANLRVASQGLSAMRFVSLGSGTGYRAVAFDAGFRKFAPEHAKPAYCAATARRLIVLQYDEGVVPDALEERQMQPNARVVELLNDLCSDPKNIVFLFSGSGKDQLTEWFAPCEKLGIAAEHGYFIRYIDSLHCGN
jgi:trehalose 6-phosphate synthase/phosphatase